jgi:hypothetical protein
VSNLGSNPNYHIKIGVVSVPLKDKEKQLAYQRKWYAKNKQYDHNRGKKRKYELKIWLEEYKSALKCSMCGEDHPACLEFHHLDPTTKEKGISKMVNHGMSKENILKEAEKCVILCSNCHRKLHYIQNDNGKHLN